MPSGLEIEEGAALVAAVAGGARIVEACQHGNPLDAACKLCGRSGSVAPVQMEQDPLGPERVELLAFAFGLLDAVDVKKQDDNWAASYAEWKERYATIDKRGTLG